MEAPTDSTSQLAPYLSREPKTPSSNPWQYQLFSSEQEEFNLNPIAPNKHAALFLKHDATKQRGGDVLPRHLLPKAGALGVDAGRREHGHGGGRQGAALSGDSRVGRDGYPVRRPSGRAGQGGWVGTVFTRMLVLYVEGGGFVTTRTLPPRKPY